MLNDGDGYTDGHSHAIGGAGEGNAKGGGYTCGDYGHISGEGTGDGMDDDEKEADLPVSFQVVLISEFPLLVASLIAPRIWNPV